MVVVAAIFDVLVINTQITEIQILTLLLQNFHLILLTAYELDLRKMISKLVTRVENLNFKRHLDGYLQRTIRDALASFQMMGKVALLEQEHFAERLCIDQNLLLAVACNPNIIGFLHLFLDGLIEPIDFDGEYFIF